MGRRLEPLRREVKVPRNRWAMPTCPIVAIVALLMLSWVSAFTASQPTSRPKAERFRPCPERKATSPAPGAGEHDCAFGELLDCDYGGLTR